MPNSSDPARTHDVYSVNWTDKKRKSTTSVKRATKGVEVVYYVLMDDGNVKIGTTTNLLERMHHSGLPGMRNRERIIAIEFGGRTLERQRHQEFAHLRVPGPGELFKPGTDLLAHAESLRQSLGIGAA